MSLVNRDYPYGMPIAMMAGLHTYGSTFSDNAATIVSPFNSDLGSGSAISNAGQNGQPQGVSRHAPP